MFPALVRLRFDEVATVCAVPASDLCWAHVGGSASHKRMQRWTARFLLLLAFAGTLLPLAMQGTAAPSHLCCRRSGEHHCHSYALTNPEQAYVTSPGCNRDCRRGVRTTAPSHPGPVLVAAPLQGLQAPEVDLRVSVPANQSYSLHSSRAPPICS
jgi:hypothetical protein